jgi:phosphomannomutase
VSFPNPEEPGAMDLALALAAEHDADLVVANDPDADRCAAAVPTGNGWRMLRGDEVGALLAHHLMSRGRSGTWATSIVSSTLLGRMAAAAGQPYVETLTGFKWIGRVPGLRFGYEEALGYCVDPGTVPDKDGITAALLIAELVATLKREGKNLQGMLDDLARQHGVHQTDSFSVRVTDLALIDTMMERLRTETPSELGGVAVRSVEDLAQGAGGLPPTDGLRYLLADETRVIARPSGTEPKLKVYLEAIVPVEGDDLDGAREEATRRLAAVRSTMEELTGV